MTILGNLPKLRTLVLASVLAFLPLSTAYAVKVGDMVGTMGYCTDAQTLESIITAPDAESAMLFQEAAKAEICFMTPFQIPVILKEKIKTIRANDGRAMEVWRGITPVTEGPVFIVGEAEGQDA